MKLMNTVKPLSPVVIIAIQVMDGSRLLVVNEKVCSNALETGQTKVEDRPSVTQCNVKSSCQNLELTNWDLSFDKCGAYSCLVSPRVRCAFVIYVRIPP